MDHAASLTGGNGRSGPLRRIREAGDVGRSGRHLHGIAGAPPRERRDPLREGLGCMLNAKVALRYTVAAAVVITGAWWLRGWGWLLLWLGVSLAAQALAYAGWGAAVFRKDGGRLPWSVRILLAPYMICARVTLHYYCRGLPPYAEAATGVWIGRRLTDPEAEEAIRKGVTAALDLTAGFPECAPLLALRYRNIQ